MTRWIAATRLLPLLLVLGACTVAPNPAHYLQTAPPGVTSEEVAQHLGPPTFRAQSPGGDFLWGYQYRRARTPDHTPDCVQYLLTFDPSHVLRSWREQPC